MTHLQFTYATQAGKQPAFQMLDQDRLAFEAACLDHVNKKYGDTLINPRIHAVVSDLNGNVLNAVMLPDSILKFE